LEEAFLVLFVGALISLCFAQILLRNFLEITWLWADPLVRHLVLWSAFVGALIATRDDRHIRIDAGLRMLPARGRQIVAAVGDSIAAATCLTLTPFAVRFVLNERAYGGDAFLELPHWILQLVFPVVFGAMGLRFSTRAARAFRSVMSTHPKI
jgi:TRAP-type C4-dicarboxylate transport system permease small subunit